MNPKIFIGPMSKNIVDAIISYSNENDVVLDNTMGSGTTCLASKELNRFFVGIEKEKQYYEIAVSRVCGS
jgi:DNA modification methylase